MNNIKRYLCTASLLLFTLTVVACGGGDQSDRNGSEDTDAHDNGQTSANPNLIDIPSAVRTNLGISFVKVERRRVAETLRVPGRFEYLPSARQEYRTPMPGRIELAVKELEHVNVGSLLYRIDSPGLRSLQQQLAETVSEMGLLKVKVETFPQLIEAHEKHEVSLQKTIDAWLRRVEQLEKLNAVGGGRQNELIQARATLSTSEAELATLLEKDAELEAQRRKTLAEIKAVESRREYLLDAVSAVTSLKKLDLIAMVDTDNVQSPRWSTINRIEIRSDVAGVVSRLGLTNGAWANETSPVLTVVQPERLRFRASGLQSDLGVLKDGLPARIVSPTPTATGRAISITQAMTGQLILGLEADPNDRTVVLFVVPDGLRDWARPGVSAQLEIVINPTTQDELAIPLASVQRDGLMPVIFRRVPGNPNQVMRVEADLGRDDGRWVELLSGVAEGDEIVLDGGFQLMLSTSGSIQKGGHFHADGTFHEGED